MNTTLRTPKHGFFMGAKKDPYDPRDFIWRAAPHLLAAGPALPALSVCDGLAMPEKFDQANESSCTGNAGARWRAWLGLKFQQYALLPIPFSRQALYWWERNLPWNADADQDNGANSRDIFYVLKNIGICNESFDPYEYSTLFNDPGPQALADAANRKIGAYHRITTVSDLKACLISGFAFTMGFQVYDSFENIGSDGIWSPNVDVEKVVGGHEVFCHGYDDTVNGGSFLFDNSWGTSWGKEGSFYMPYSFLNNYDASQWDAWTGHFGIPWK
jgi:hypothetical protein